MSQARYTTTTAPPQAAIAGTAGSRLIYLDLLRIVAVFAVVWAHVSAPYALMRLPDISRENWLIGIAFFYVGRIGVPTFLMISGALILKPDSSETLVRFYWKRLPRIIIPLVLWKLIYYFLLVYPADFNAVSIIKFILADNYTFWFMYMIACVYLAVPFLSRMVKAGGLGLIFGYVAISFTLHLIGIWFRYHPELKNGFSIYEGFFSKYVAYFLLGYLLRHVEIPQALRRPWFLPACIAVPVGFTVAATAWFIPQDTNVSPFLDNMLPMMVMMTTGLFMAFRQWFPDGRGCSARTQGALRVLGAAGLGVYMLHSLVLIKVTPFVQSLWPNIMEHPCLYVPIATVLAYIASVVIIVPISKIPLARHLT